MFRRQWAVHGDFIGIFADFAAVAGTMGAKRIDDMHRHGGGRGRLRRLPKREVDTRICVIGL
ncbi:hypothetical protein QMZ05_16200 [Bradyrhizobium sp. INPA03-11B]|uniref:hypothetical protein n=1 Tax=Bradyrhizobium sp. INPA03-11B TaxID=418598 RepID=UPI00338DA1B1